ncbi:MAG: zf-HC2 domain-containing protein [Propionibacteriaceae bacterium]|nr:zf-HC2 domain-containing protein [Propionibacteriaceae bacterium]
MTLDLLADADEELLTAVEQARVDAHLRDCAECRELAQELTDATAAVRELSAPAMPADVLERLTNAVRAESERRATGIAAAEEEAGIADASKRTDIGSFRQNPLMGKTLSPEQAHLVGRTWPTGSQG